MTAWRPYWMSGARLVTIKSDEARIRGMSVTGWRNPAYSRRSFLALAAAGGAMGQRPPAARENLPSDAKRYVDPATEFMVLRLTEPTYSSFLAAPWNRCITRRGLVLYASDRGGKMDVLRMDVKGGESVRLTDARQLDPHSVALVPNDRSFCYLDGRTLCMAPSSGGREREVYQADAGFDRIATFALDVEGANAYVIERKEQRSRVRLVNLARGSAATLLESADEIGMPVARPGGGLAYRAGGILNVWARPGTTRALTLPEGRATSAYWSADGTSLLYLNVPEKRGELNSIRQHVVASGEDKLIAKTTQFIQFVPNADQSVFAGASGSKASPHVLILVRSVRRELTVCEHRARDPRSLGVAFALNSQRVVFQSDQHGNPALFMIAVERFVEETES
jgi:oligogalacturonide lyase